MERLLCKPIIALIQLFHFLKYISLRNKEIYSKSLKFHANIMLLSVLKLEVFIAMPCFTPSNLEVIKQKLAETHFYRYFPSQVKRATSNEDLASQYA